MASLSSSILTGRGLIAPMRTVDGFGLTPPIRDEDVFVVSLDDSGGTGDTLSSGFSWTNREMVRFDVPSLLRWAD